MGTGTDRCPGKTVGIRRRRATVKRPVRASTGQKARPSHCPATPGWEGCADQGEPLSQETGEVLPAASFGLATLAAGILSSFASRDRKD